MSTPRRTPEEWATVFEIDRATKTIFTEGPSDAHLLATAIALGRNVDIRSAEEIQIDEPIEGGNKLRIITLSKLARERNIENCKLLVDRDFEYFLHLYYNDDNLLRTDYANIISGSISLEWARTFFLRAFNSDFSLQNWKDLTRDLKSIFILRYFCISQKISHSNVDISNFSNFRDGRLIFRKRDFLYSFLQSGNDTKNAILKELESFEDYFRDDERYFIHSSDLFLYIHTFLRKSRRIGGAFPKDGTRSAVLGSLPSNLGNQMTIGVIANWAS